VLGGQRCDGCIWFKHSAPGYHSLRKPFDQLPVSHTALPASECEMSASIMGVSTLGRYSGDTHVTEMA
jgi:hypothetical protein